MKRLLALVFIAALANAQVPPFTQLSDAERISLQNLLRELDIVSTETGRAETAYNVAVKKYKDMREKVETAVFELKRSHGALDCGFTANMLFQDCGNYPKATPPVKAAPAPAVPPGPKGKK